MVVVCLLLRASELPLGFCISLFFFPKRVNAFGRQEKEKAEVQNDLKRWRRASEKRLVFQRYNTKSAEETTTRDLAHALGCAQEQK